MLNNIDIAVLAKVNELAGRHGLKPYDFVATIRMDEITDKTVLAYETVPEDTPEVKRRFNAMVDAVGADKASGKLEGTDQIIIDALDNAIARAPKGRSP